MKKSLLYFSFVSLSTIGFAQTQIGNGSFESWETSTLEINEPTNWNSFQSASGSLSGFAGEQMDRRVNARPGSTGTQSARIWSRDAGFGVKANGNMTLGRINMGSTSPSNSNNHNYTSNSTTGFSEAFTDSPDSIVAWVRYKPGNTTAGYNARISTVIHNNTNNYKDPNDVSGTNTVATAILNFPYTNGAWQRISVPFTYVGTASNAAYILVTFTTNSVPGGGTTSDTLYVDDVELIYVPNPSFTSTNSTICPGSTVTYTNTSTHYPTSYSWSFPGGTPSTSTAANPVVTYATPGNYNVVLTATNQWGSKTITSTNYVTVNEFDDATFSYAQSTFCADAGNQTPTVVDLGAFTASPSGLTINSSTGEVDLAASSAGTYTVTNATSGACPDTENTSITINAVSDASFSFPSNTICNTDVNQIPTAANAGVFASSPSGLVFVSSTTGEIDVAASTVGTYIISHDVPGICPGSFDVSVTITANPDASFSYAQGAFCMNNNDPSPVFVNGASAGVFSAIPSGLSINNSNGMIDLSASSAGTYTVSNDIAAVGACAASNETFTVIVNELPNVTLGAFQDVCVYNASFALTGGLPAGGTYSGTGVISGNFDPATAGNGIQTITYTYTDGTTSCSNSANETIIVDACLGLDNSEDFTVSVYPNPTAGLVTISDVVSPTQVVVYTVNGTKILSTVTNNGQTTIDLNNLAKGTYFLQLSSEKGTKTVQLILN